MPEIRWIIRYLIAVQILIGAKEEAEKMINEILEDREKEDMTFMDINFAF